MDFHPRLILHVTTSQQLVKGVYKDQHEKFNASLNSMISFLIKRFFFVNTYFKQISLQSILSESRVYHKIFKFQNMRVLDDSA